MTMIYEHRGRPLSHDVVIVGGGIAGLAAALHLAQHARDLSIALVERAQRLGGKLLTGHVDGFIVEGGADSFLASKPEGLALCNEIGVSDELIGTNPESRRAYVVDGGALHRIPDGLSGLVPSRLEPFLESSLLSPEGKRRLEQETSVAARESSSDESLASFIERRFGSELYERVVEPLMAGIYAGDGAQLSVDATFPQLRRFEREYGSVMLALRAAQDRPQPTARPPVGTSAFLTPIDGMGRIVSALTHHLHTLRISTGSQVTSLGPLQDGYEIRLDDGHTIAARAVILAVPAFDAAAMIEGLDADLASALSSIEYVSTATVSLAFRSSDISQAPDGSGFIVPRREQRDVLACTWTTNKFAHRAPAGYFLARAFIGRAGREDVLRGTDADLISIARREMQEVAFIKATPVLERVYRWPRGMPQYTLGYLECLKEVDRLCGAHGGLFVAGHAFGGVGVPDCIKSGTHIARRVLEHVRSNGTLTV
ncbi:MAG: protoporphyrinogen oxidase [Chloroflexota bacterium]